MDGSIDDEVRHQMDPACELFRLGDPEYRSFSLLNRVWLPAAGGLMGGVMAATHNLMNRRPVRAGKKRSQFPSLYDPTQSPYVQGRVVGLKPRWFKPWFN